MLCCSKRILSKKILQSPSSLSAAYATVCSLSVCAQDISVQLCSTVRAVVQCCLICCCIPPPLFRDNPHQPAAVIIRLKKSETEGAKFETTGALKDERWNQDRSHLSIQRRLASIAITITSRWYCCHNCLTSHLGR